MRKYQATPLLVFLLTACVAVRAPSNESDVGSKPQGSIISSSTSTNARLERLDSPTGLTITNIKVGQEYRFSFKGVSNAIAYEGGIFNDASLNSCVVSGSVANNGTLTDCGIDVNGTYYFAIKALGDEVNYLDSEWSAPVARYIDVGNEQSGSEQTTSSSSESTPSEETSSESQYVPAGATLKWSDEFEGSSLNASYWSAQIGNGQDYGIWEWGNSEKQYYKEENATVANGKLTITAKAEETQYGSITYYYSSSRLRTYQKVSTTYGYIEAKIKLPAIQGMWPAFWMLPESTYADLGWPCSGEIDIMEARGRNVNDTTGALHYASDGTGNTHTYQTGNVWVDSIANWHCYAVQWTANEIQWYVDGNNFLSVSKDVWNAGYGSASGPFSAPFHIILNLAVGGMFDNGILPPSDFTSAAMEVDYVRIYSL